MNVINNHRTLFVAFFLISYLFYKYHLGFYLGDNINYIAGDSKYYFVASTEWVETISDVIDHLSRNMNLFGPIFFFKFILFEKLFLFFIVSISFYMYGVYVLYKNLHEKKEKNLVIFFLLVFPPVIVSFSGPNKEITSLISVIFLINYLKIRNFRYLGISLVFAFFTRFELLLVLTIFLIIQKFEVKKQYKILGVLLVVLSMYLMIIKTSNLSYNTYADLEHSLGVVNFLSILNDNGFYFLTFLPKLLINFFGDIFKISPLDLKGEVLIFYISQLYFLLLIPVLLYKLKKLVYNRLFIFLILYCLVFCIPGFIQHRYVMPIYPVLICILFLNNNDNDTKIFHNDYQYKTLLVTLLVTLFIIIKPYTIILNNYFVVKENIITKQKVILYPGFHFYIPRIEKLKEHSMSKINPFIFSNNYEWYENNQEFFKNKFLIYVNFNTLDTNSYRILDKNFLYIKYKIRDNFVKSAYENFKEDSTWDHKLLFVNIHKIIKNKLSKKHVNEDEFLSDLKIEVDNFYNDKSLEVLELKLISNDEI